MPNYIIKARLTTNPMPYGPIQAEMNLAIDLINIRTLIIILHLENPTTTELERLMRRNNAIATTTPSSISRHTQQYE